MPTQQICRTKENGSFITVTCACSSVGGAHYGLYNTPS